MNKHTEWTSGRVQRRTQRVVLLLLIFVLTAGMLLPSDAASKIKPKKLTIRLSASSVQVGQKASARVVKAVPPKASKAVKWKSSNAKVAKISQKGSITPLKAGKVRITAVSKLNKKISASAVLTVKKAKTTVKTGVETTDGITIDHDKKIGDTPSKIANKDYSHVNVTLTWPGQETPLPLSQVLLDDNGNHPDLDMVFTGNQKNQIASASGCMICTNSCYYGTISNQANGYTSVGKYHIDAAHFPAADTLVTVTVSLK
jgi:hypothetical protein